MRGYIFICFAIILIINQSRTIHGLFRLPLGLSIPTSLNNHQQIYVQPQQQLIIYPLFHRIPLPQSFYEATQNLFVPPTSFTEMSRLISPQQVNVGYSDPIVTYIHQQPPYQTSSYMNFNLGKRLSNMKPVEEEEINLRDDEKSTDSVGIKSGDKLDCNDSHDEGIKKEMPDKMEITTNNTVESTTTIFEVMKSEMENQKNQEDSTTIRDIEINTEGKIVEPTVEM